MNYVEFDVTLPIIDEQGLFLLENTVLIGYRDNYDGIFREEMESSVDYDTEQPLWEQMVITFYVEFEDGFDGFGCERYVVLSEDEALQIAETVSYEQEHINAVYQHHGPEIDADDL